MMTSSSSFLGPLAGPAACVEDLPYTTPCTIFPGTVPPALVATAKHVLGGRQQGCWGTPPFIATPAALLAPQQHQPTFYPTRIQDEIVQLQQALDKCVGVLSGDSWVPNVYEMTSDSGRRVRCRQVEAVPDPESPSTGVVVVCRVCHGYAPLCHVAAAARDEAKRPNWWRFGSEEEGRLNFGKIVKTMRSHCGFFKSSMAVRHKALLEMKTGLCLESAERPSKRRRQDFSAGHGDRRRRAVDRAGAPRRKSTTRPKKDEQPGVQLQLLDDNDGTWVDTKRDKGRSIRYLRLNLLLNTKLLEYREAHPPPPDAPPPPVVESPAVDESPPPSPSRFDELVVAAASPSAAEAREEEECLGILLLKEAAQVISDVVSSGAPVVTESDSGATDSPSLKPAKPKPPPLKGEQVMALMTVLLTGSYIDKLPVTRAADVRELSRVKERLVERVRWLRPSRSDTREVARLRQSLCMAVLFVAHQLWTPSRMRRFVRRLVEILEGYDQAADAGEPIDDPGKWGDWVRQALELSAADTRAAPSQAELLATHQEIAMENDVFTGRHRTRTTVAAVLEAGWTGQWDKVLQVATVFVDQFESARASGVIGDHICRSLVDRVKTLPSVGVYTGAHLVRSLVGVIDLRIPRDAWGAFTMSDTTVGDMIDRIKPLGSWTPCAAQRRSTPPMLRRLVDAARPGQRPRAPHSPERQDQPVLRARQPGPVRRRRAGAHPLRNAHMLPVYRTQPRVEFRRRPARA